MTKTDITQISSLYNEAIILAQRGIRGFACSPLAKVGCANCTTV
jgi:hypothetical protein